MELKVYIENAMRVVYGLDESTSVYDVIVALAEAIGQTGKFYLIEKTNNNERVVSPSEKPLNLLKKYSGNPKEHVKFILKRVDNEKILSSETASASASASGTNESLSSPIVDDYKNVNNDSKQSTIISEDDDVESAKLTDSDSNAYEELFELICMQQTRLTNQSKELNKLFEQIEKHEISCIEDVKKKKDFIFKDDSCKKEKTSNSNIDINLTKNILKSEGILRYLDNQKAEIENKINEFKSLFNMKKIFLKHVEGQIEYLNSMIEKTKAKITLRQKAMNVQQEYNNAFKRHEIMDNTSEQLSLYLSSLNEISKRKEKTIESLLDQIEETDDDSDDEIDDDSDETVDNDSTNNAIVAEANKDVDETELDLSLKTQKKLVEELFNYFNETSEFGKLNSSAITSTINDESFSNTTQFIMNQRESNIMI